MAAGVVTEVGLTRKLKLLEAATATNGSPVGTPTAGYPIGDLVKGGSPDGTIFIASTAGSGTMTVTLRLWGYDATANAWAPLGTGTAALKGILNGGVAIAEDSTIGADVLRHTEVVGSLWAFDRIYLEITAIGGTATAISAWLVIPAMQAA
jgi:hypothetical protein